MSGLPSWGRAFACLVFSFCACGPEALTPDYGCDDVGLGALVVTEVHANPDGRDGDGEYVEVFNTSEAPISLQSITLMVGRADGASPKSHRIREGAVAAGDYFVVGNASGTNLPDHIDYSYADALGNLRNSEGSVSLWCGSRLIDRVNYARTPDGLALELDGDLEPNHETNDESNAWCATPEGADDLGDGNLGTPGRRNSPCARPPVEGACTDGGAARALLVPRAEDVRITEWMPNPEGLDADFEWIEVTFGAAADLNGLQLGPSTRELVVAIDADPCFRVDAGARVVFGASPAAAPRVDAELPISLGNSGSRSIVVGLHGEVLDVARYEGATEGAAWQIDADSGLCLAPESTEYARGNFGTPGQPNPPCPPVLQPGMCLQSGRARGIISPVVGQAQITEWMADPSMVENRAGEWVEVRLDAPVDLNGLTLTDLSGSSASIESDDCLAVVAGTHLVWARTVDHSVNGGVESAIGELSLSLNNRGETISLSAGGEILDSVSYERSEPGIATQVDPLGNVCNATTHYGDGDLGTPGLPNPWCF
jgi:hypothetical protein